MLTSGQCLDLFKNLVSEPANKDYNIKERQAKKKCTASGRISNTVNAFLVTHS